jgi:hypothetical protein
MTKENNNNGGWDKVALKVITALMKKQYVGKNVTISTGEDLNGISVNHTHKNIRKEDLNNKKIFSDLLKDLTNSYLQGDGYLPFKHNDGQNYALRRDGVYKISASGTPENKKIETIPDDFLNNIVFSFNPQHHNMDFGKTSLTRFDRSAQSSENSKKTPEEVIKKTFKRSSKDFNSYVLWRNSQTPPGAQPQISRIKKSSTKSFVVIQSTHYNGENQSFLEERTKNLNKTIQFCSQHIGKKEYAVVNNSGSHWDLTKVKDSTTKTVTSSGNNLACGCYTLMNIVIQYHSSADKNYLTDVLRKLPTQEQKQIEQLIDNKTNSSSLSPQLVRKFTKLSIEQLIKRSGASGLRNLALQNVVKDNYELTADDLCLALEGLGINYLEQSTFLVKNQDLEKTILNNLLKSTPNATDSENRTWFERELQNAHRYFEEVLEEKTSLEDLRTQFNQTLPSQKQILIENMRDLCCNLGLETKKENEEDFFHFTSNTGAEYLIPQKNDGTLLFRTQPQHSYEELNFANNEGTYTEIIASLELALSDAIKKEEKKEKEQSKKKVQFEIEPTTIPKEKQSINFTISEYKDPKPSPHNPEVSYIGKAERKDKKNVTIAQIKQNESFAGIELEKRAQEAAIDIIGNASKALREKVSVGNINLFIKTMKDLAQQKINSDDDSGKKVGFTAWKNEIKKDHLTGNSEEKKEQMKQFKLISTEIQKQAYEYFDTAEGKKYVSDNDKNVGARSYRVVQLLPDNFTLSSERSTKSHEIGRS